MVMVARSRLEEMVIRISLKYPCRSNFHLSTILALDYLKTQEGLECLWSRVMEYLYYKEDQTVYSRASSYLQDHQNQSNQTALQCFHVFLLLTRFLPPLQQELVLSRLYLNAFACTFKLFFRFWECLPSKTFLKACCKWCSTYWIHEIGRLTYFNLSLHRMTLHFAKLLK